MKILQKQANKVLGLFLFLTTSLYAKDLDAFLSESLKKHPALLQKEYELKAEKERLSSSGTLEDPMIGWMKEGEMKSWTLSQNLKFPTKYFKLHDIQKAQVAKEQSSLSEAFWDYRAKTLLSLFRFDIAKQNLKLLEVQKENLKDALKLLASRRASGGVKQQEELRSYIEQTKLETEILLSQQILSETKAELESLVGPELFADLPTDLKRPKLKVSFDDSHQGPQLSKAFYSLEAAKEEDRLSKWEYLPDFKLSYKAPLEKNESDKTIGIEMTLPLWFWTKQSSESSRAQALRFASEREWELKKREQKSNVTSLQAKVETMEKLLSLYETSLLPQAQSALQSNLSSYRSGGIRFIEVIDAQRLLFEERRSYHENILKYVEAILDLEKNLGLSVSTFPAGEIL